MTGLQPLVVDPELEAVTATLDGDSLSISNELHQCRGLRKLHLETARLGLGLQILHCVFFPDPRYDLPIFGADIVASQGTHDFGKENLLYVTVASRALSQLDSYFVSELARWTLVQVAT